jgi:hypothetical protein
MYACFLRERKKDGEREREKEDLYLFLEYFI